jgi:hypothetical protein
MHQSGIEPGSITWQGTILPLDHWCFVVLDEDVVEYLTVPILNHERRNVSHTQNIGLHHNNCNSVSQFKPEITTRTHYCGVLKPKEGIKRMKVETK